MRDAESEGDILGRQTKKSLVNNTAKNLMSAHDGIRSRSYHILHLIIVTCIMAPYARPHTILCRSDIAQDELLS